MLPSGSTGPISRITAALALAAAATLATAIAVGATTAPPPAVAHTADTLAAEAAPPMLDVDRLAAATVLVSPARFDPLETGWGSGSIVSGDGLILTNAHVAANRAPGVSILYPEIRYAPPSPDTLYVYTVDTATDRAQPTYQAKVVAADGYLDLAVLRITAYADGVVLDPADLSLSAVPIGTARDLQPLDELVVTGYPGLADSFAVRFTRGELNNFSDDDPIGRDAWLHTSAKLAAGNSGGLAVDSEGRLVAVPTQSTSDEPSGAVDFNMRPIDLALPLIDAAQAGEPYDPYRYVAPPSGDERATVLGWSDESSDTCVSGGDSIPSGTQFAVAQVRFDGMNTGDHVLVEFVRLDGTASAEIVDFEAFDWPAWLDSSVCLPIELGHDRAFPDGSYRTLLSGDYGVQVSVGPADEFDATQVSSAVTVRVADVRSPDSGPGTLPPLTRSIAPETVARAPSRGEVEEVLRRAGAQVGLRCKRYRAHAKNDPFAYGATGATLCDEDSDASLEGEHVFQYALFRFLDGSSMADYWGYRLGEFPANLTWRFDACSGGTRGITTWTHGDVACYVSKSSAGTKRARIRWTDERTNTYGVLDATDTKLARLVRWWQDHTP